MSSNVLAIFISEVIKIHHDHSLVDDGGQDYIMVVRPVYLALSQINDIFTVC